tara:strand:+ start:5223 stop:6332 length:1110 start_codon:yes stop_codon:yes gene_type:complete
MATLVRTPVAKKINAAFSPGFLTFSSTGPVSGVSAVGYFSGPHYVETQTLEISYKRVPRFKFDHETLNLSSVTLSPHYLGTHLLLKIRPRVTKEKVYDWYETSSYTQPQRFTVYSVSADDQSGQTYGTPAAGTLSVKGDILTTQPWYFRRPWTTKDDTDSATWTTNGVVTPQRYAEALRPHPNHPGYTGLPGVTSPGYALQAFSYRPFANDMTTDCYKDALIGPEYPNSTHPPFFDVVGLTNVNFWHTIAGETLGDSEVQTTYGTPTRSGDDTCLPPGQMGPTFRANAIVDNHMLGNKLGAYSSEQDNTADVQILVDGIADIIAKQWNDGSVAFESNYFVGPLLQQPYTGRWQSLTNTEYSKSRHYWGN